MPKLFTKLFKNVAAKEKAIKDAGGATPKGPTIKVNPEGDKFVNPFTRPSMKPSMKTVSKRKK